MHPILFHLGSFEVRAWGLMVAIGVIAGMALALRLARKEGIEEEIIYDFVMWAIIAGLLGARIWEVAFSWQNYTSDPLSALKFWDGGLSIQGAIAGGTLAAVWFIKKRGLQFWRFADIGAPSLILGQAIGRIGCFLNGDAFGIPTSSWFGVIYQPGTPAFSMYGAIPLVPAELMEGAGDLLILGILLLLLRHRPYRGFVALMYFVLYSLLRFTLEFWRGDSLLVANTLKAAQVSSLVIAVTAIVLILFRLRIEGNNPPK